MDQENAAIPDTPPDFGPFYAETDLAQFPVEPLATYANVAFLLILIHWALRTRLNFRRHPLIVGSLPLLALGWIGGTLYHATRSHTVWLILDFAPIFMLVLLATVYFWKKVTGSWLWTAVLGAGPVLVYREIALSGALPVNYFITLGYAMLGGNLLVPTLWHCSKYNRKAVGSIVAAIVAFACALSFRQYDFELARTTWLPTGSHFLWHLCGAASAYFLLHYVYLEPEETP